MIKKILQGLIKVVLLGIGIGLFLFWIRKLGVDALAQTLQELKADWWKILLVSLLWNFFYAMAWRSYFVNLNRHIPFWSLFKIKICGEAMNLMTPLNFVVGDPVRFAMVQKRISGYCPSGSILTDRLLNSLATVFFVWMGIVIAFFSPYYVPRHILWIVFGLYSLINIFFITILYLIYKHQAVGQIHKIMHWIPFKKVRSFMENAVDEMVVEFDFLKDKALTFFAPAFLCHLAGRFLGAVEILIILKGLQFEGTILLGIILASLTAACNLIFAFLPGALGVMETFYSLFFKWQGLSDVFGIPIQLIRRIRAFFWILVGLILLMIPARKRAS
ncbi:MAG: hypothetical protein ACD_73C00075G0004 [uncultured bacterium]|nr:MAG: hypothetical protein ACD_73C00075G0004 [uncultured bacterium]